MRGVFSSCLLNLARLTEKSLKQHQVPRRIGVEETIPVCPEGFPDSLDPCAGVFRDLDACAAAGQKARVARQLESFQCGDDGAARRVKGHRELAGRRRSAKEQHRHARQVVPMNGENLGRHAIELVRGILQPRDFPSDGLRQATPCAIGTAGLRVRPHGAHHVRACMATSILSREFAARSSKTQQASGRRIQLPGDIVDA
jgi:hypothetical protein